MEKSRRMRADYSFNIGKQVIVGSFVILSTLIFSLFFIVEAALSPFQVGREEALALARKHVELKGPAEVALYNGKEAYYSVRGKNGLGQELVVFVSEESTDIFVYQMSAGKTQVEAVALAQAEGASIIDRVTLGYTDKQPVWEVKSGTVYYLISFETGELLKKEGL